MTLRAWLSLGPALVALVAACGSPIVGAECRPGLVRCDGNCVDLDDDAAHCGRCGHDCGAFECRASMCGPGPRPDAGLDAGGDGGVDAGDGGNVGGGRDGGRPAGVGKGGVGSPFSPDSGSALGDAGAEGCALGQSQCADECADTRLDALHCGACGHACTAEQYCIAGVCEDACDAPLRLCGAQCIDFQVDEHHCGGCGHVCLSGICNAGECADVIPGSLVVVGHDYSAGSGSIPSAMKRIAGNAVFLAKGAPVRTLVYRGKAKAASCDGVIDAIQTVVDMDGREWQPHTVDVDDVTEALDDADAFVICPQASASDAELATLAGRWNLAMRQFLYRGGVIVLFETLTASNAGTYRLLGEPAGLFAAASRQAVMPARQTLVVQNPGVGVALRATSTYRSSPATVHFVDVQGDATVVVKDNAGEPVVIHRVIAP